MPPSPFRGYRHGYQQGWQFPTLRAILYFLSQRFGLILMKYFADKVLVLNSLDKQTLEKQGLINKVSVVEMGVDLKEFAKVFPSAKIYDACFIGRFHLQKGIFDLIETWKMVCQKKPKAKLALIGGGSKEFQEKLKQTIAKQGLTKNILFLGFQIGEKKIKVLKQSKIFVLPSFYESWGMVAVEAMAAGLPVIAYNLPIFSKIFPQGMIRVPIGKKKTLAREILYLLQNKGFYQEMKKEASKQAQDYDWQKVARREVELFEEL